LNFIWVRKGLKCCQRISGTRVGKLERRYDIFGPILCLRAADFSFSVWAIAKAPIDVFIFSTAPLGRMSIN
jgi:hypothetical protein